jgi:1-phosphofructokinase
MIVTVTPNPAIDRSLWIRGFAIGTTNRAVSDRTDIGGKGINVARHLAHLGYDVLATGFLGDRDRHGVIETLAAQGVQTDFVRTAGHTRLNLKIFDSVSGEETEINEPGTRLPAEAVEVLLEKLGALATGCSVMVFSGSLPPGVPDDLYARGIALVASAGVKTILDATGTALRHGIAARPDLVKPNRAEAEELLSTQLPFEGEVIAAAKRLVEHGARAGVISLGSDGAVAASPRGAWRARAPQITARNTIGSGDAMVAALACALMRSLEMPEALRLATALGSAAAASHSPIPPAGHLEALLPEVLVESVPESADSDSARIES